VVALQLISMVILRSTTRPNGAAKSAGSFPSPYFLLVARFLFLNDELMAE
jgi:hypothetical protein